jgi:hypothetical protein
MHRLILLRIDTGFDMYQDMIDTHTREVHFKKFQKFDNYFMAVKLVSLEYDWFRPAQIRYASTVIIGQIYGFA